MSAPRKNFPQDKELQERRGRRSCLMLRVRRPGYLPAQLGKGLRVELRNAVIRSRIKERR